MNKILRKFALQHLDKFELIFLVFFLILLIRQANFTDPGIFLLLYNCAAFLMLFIYTIALFLRPVYANPYAVSTYRYSRLGLSVEILALVFYANSIKGFPVLLTVSALILALLPMKSQLVDRQKPPRSEIIRISVGLIIAAAMFFAFYSSLST